jgi:hypothetical protein
VPSAAVAVSRHPSVLTDPPRQSGIPRIDQEHVGVSLSGQVERTVCPTAHLLSRPTWGWDMTPKLVANVGRTQKRTRECVTIATGVCDYLWHLRKANKLVVGRRFPCHVACSLVASFGRFRRGGCQVPLCFSRLRLVGAAELTRLIQLGTNHGMPFLPRLPTALVARGKPHQWASRAQALWTS